MVSAVPPIRMKPVSADCAERNSQTRRVSGASLLVSTPNVRENVRYGWLNAPSVRLRIVTQSRPFTFQTVHAEPGGDVEKHRKERPHERRANTHSVARMPVGPDEARIFFPKQITPRRSKMNHGAVCSACRRTGSERLPQSVKGTLRRVCCEQFHVRNLGDRCRICKDIRGSSADHPRACWVAGDHVHSSEKTIFTT